MTEKYFNTYTNKEMNKYPADAFVQAREAMKLPPVKKRPGNATKLYKKQARFLNGHSCKQCGAQLELVKDTNIMQCPECGHFMLLREKKSLIAQSLLQEGK